MARPAPGDYPAYYEPYISLISDTGIVARLEEQMNIFSDFLVDIPLEKENYRYAEGKWSVKEVIGHILDTERVMAYRALRFARNDSTPLPGFDEKEYTRNSSYSERTMLSLIDEFRAVRAATVHLVKYMDENEMQRRGTANQKMVTVNALFYIIAGHAAHHVAIIKNRYLDQA